MIKLYKLDSKGRLRHWNIWFQDNTIFTSSGLVDGRPVISKTPITSGKNLGRSNETTIEQQAQLDIQSEVTKKLAEGYVSEPLQATSNNLLGSGCPKPMLANKYHPTASQTGSKNLDQLGLRGKKVGLSPKLDGNRCLAHLEFIFSGGASDGAYDLGVTLYTRKGKFFNSKIDHILTALSHQMEGMMTLSCRVESMWLDGELYSPEVSFNELNGILKKMKPTQEELDKLHKVEYHIYDVMQNVGYEDRYNMLKYVIVPNDLIKIVPVYFTEANEKNIDDYHEKFRSQGWEGLMIRQLGVAYEHKRSNQLLKYKSFEDNEYVVVGFNESTEGGILGSIQFKVGDSDATFAARFKGTDEQQKYIWEHQDEFLGKIMTVEYQNLSEYGIPRFPVAVKFERNDI